MRRFRAIAFALSAVALTAAPAAAGASYSVTTEGDQVLRWNPCAAIDVRVNMSSAPSGARADLRGALTRLRRASGLPLRLVGTTSVVPNRRNEGRYAGITVAWAGNEQSDRLDGTAAGEGGYSARAFRRDGSGGWAWRITSGYVVIDTASNARLRAGFGAGGTRGALLLHELGHVVGLNHVDDRGQLMYPVIATKAPRWGSGDLTGLASVGRPAGCIR